MHRAMAVLATAVLLVVPAVGAVADDGLAGAARLQRLSLAHDGGDTDGDSLHPVISANGRYVVFESAAENVVAGDDNAVIDIFVVDRVTRATELVSLSSDGEQVDDHTSDPDISADGRFVTFMAAASNLVPGDTNGTWDVFVRDRANGTTERVSVASDGTEGNDASLRPTISADGMRVAFSSDATNLGGDPAVGGRQVFVHDRATRTTTLVSTNADGEQAAPLGAGAAQISADGRYVAFSSTAINLDEDVETNINADIFLKDTRTGSIERVSVATDGTPGNDISQCASMSRDATHVVFASRAGNLVPADFNGTYDYFVRDRVNGRTERVNVTSAGGESIGMSASWVCPLAISDDGRYVSYETPAADLVDGDDNRHLDVFVHDRVTGATERVSLSAAGEESAGSSHNTSISADGRYVVFQGNGDDLVGGDANEAGDVFVFDRGPQLGVGALRAQGGDDAVTVEGWANFDGEVIVAATDPEDARPRRLGADITYVAVAHRPESDALSITWEVRDLPGVRGSSVPVDGTAVTRGVTAPPGVLYGLRLRTAQATYVLLGGRSADAPLVGFSVYACTNTCEEVASVDGSIGVTGDEARAVLPLSAIGTTRLDVSDLQAFTAGTTAALAADSVTWLDRVVLGSIRVEPANVAVGVGDDGTDRPGIDFREVDLRDEVFRAVIRPEGSASRRAWARACYASVCTYASHAIARP